VARAKGLREHSSGIDSSSRINGRPEIDFIVAISSDQRIVPISADQQQMTYRLACQQISKQIGGRRVPYRKPKLPNVTSRAKIVIAATKGSTTMVGPSKKSGRSWGEGDKISIVRDDLVFHGTV